MSRVWLIDGKAFNSARWRSFVRDSLKDMRVFLRDLNATLNDDGTLNITGFQRSEDGELQRIGDEARTDYENHPLYETNRGALIEQTLSPDGYDTEILASFDLPIEERYERFDMLYAAAIQGDCGSLYESWAMIPDSAKLVHTLHLWERLQKRKLPPQTWAAALHLSWPHGKVGSMLFRANLGEKEVVQMFSMAPRQVLMASEDMDIFTSMPSEFTAWRGVSSAAKYRTRGFSWTLNKDRAEWFALANAAHGTPLILEGRFKRESVLMCSTFEEEVVINPGVQPLSVLKITVDSSDTLARLSALREALAAQSTADLLEGETV